MRRDGDSVRIGTLAGVSRSTVRKVINNYPDICEAARAKLRALIRDHQYYSALSLQIPAGKKTTTIGLFLARGCKRHHALEETGVARLKVCSTGLVEER